MNRDHALLPVFAAAFAVACLSLMDAFMKSAALAVGALTAAWLRSKYPSRGGPVGAPRLPRLPRPATPAPPALALASMFFLTLS